MQVFLVINFILFLVLVLSGCNNSSNNLTGLWRLDYHNIPYVLVDNSDSVQIKVCNQDAQFSLSRLGSDLIRDGETLLNIQDDSILKYTDQNPVLNGLSVYKESNQAFFDAGKVTITQDSIEFVGASQNVCAYVAESPNHHYVSFPHQDGYILLEFEINNPVPGVHNIPEDSEATIIVNLPSTDETGIKAKVGTINILTYVESHMIAKFNFVDDAGVNYSGEVDVNLWTTLLVN